MGDSGTMERRKKKRRARSLLKHFYGSADGTQEDSNDATNINSGVFDPQPYYEKILRESTLQNLVREDNRLVAEIRSLDTDMKTLVYENYNKFISATDTIKVMKKNVVNMEVEMKRLEENIDRMMGLSERLDQTFSVRRDKIDDLSSVKRLLDKRQFLFELPTRLTKAVEMGAYAQATVYWKNTQPVLAKYSNLPSFRAIHSESAAIIGELIATLRAVVRNPKVSDNEVGESIGLLLQLDADAADLRGEFIERRVNALNAIVEEFAAKSPTDFQAPSTDDERSVEREDKAVVDEASDDDGLEDQDETEGKAAREKSKNEPSSPPQQKKSILEQFVIEFHQKLFGEFVDFLGAYERMFVRSLERRASQKEARSAFNGVADVLFDRYADTVRRFFAQCGTSEEIIAALCIVCSNMVSLNSQVPELNLAQRANDLAHMCVNGRIEKQYAGLCTRIEGRIGLIRYEIRRRYGVSPSDEEGAHGNNDGDESLSDNAESRLLMQKLSTPEMAQTVAEWLSDDVTGYLADIQPFLASKENFLVRHSGAFVAKMHVKVQQWILFFIIQLQDIVESATVSDAPSWSATFILTLSRLSLYLKGERLGEVAARLENIARVVGEDSSMFINIPDLRSRLLESAEKLVSSYVSSQGAKISQMIRKGTELREWLVGVKEPRDVRQVAELVVDEIEALSSEVDKLYPNKNNAFQRSHQRQQSDLTQLDRSVSSVTRIFEEKLVVFGPIGFDRESIVLGVVKVVLKSFVECVRVQTFGTFGLQQIQVEVYYFRAVLKPLVRNGRIVDRMLDEVLDSASDRCVDPTLMNSEIVTLVCRPRLEKRELMSS